jgi:hypothetical protein
MRPLLCMLALSLLGCLPARTTRPDLGGRGGGYSTGGTTGNAVLGQKVVHGKQDPATLIAVDGSKCIVPEKRFREVVVGEKVVCGWGQ